MKVLVTGANGLLGTNTIHALTTAGVAVRALLRDRKKFLLPPHPLVELMEGDVTNATAVAEAVSGCTHIVHAAALTRQDERYYRPYHLANVTGTRNLLDAALNCQVQRFVFVSTANTLGFGTASRPGREVDDMKKPFANSLYARSKNEAERLVEAAARELSVAILHPTFMLGPFDAAPSSGRILTMAWGKKVVFHPPGGKNFVHVGDVAAGILEVLQRNVSGERYLLANENLSYREFFQALAAKSARPPVLIGFPKSVLIIAGYMGDVLRLVGIRTALSSVNMRILCVNNFYANTKAREELGLTFRPIEVAVEEAITWFKERKMIQ